MNNYTRFGLALFLSAILIAAPAMAQETAPVGSVASVEGGAEIRHDGAWRPAAVGDSVWAGDVLRTGAQGRLRIVFEAHSVLLVANDSEVVVEDVSSEPLTTQLRLARGKVRAVVEKTFTEPGAIYEIATPIAVATVRGTDFIIVFDPVAAVQMPSDSGRTDVVGIDGRVEVHSSLDLLEHGVFVTAYELTIVERSQKPAAPQRLDETMFQQYLEGLEFIGGGSNESAARSSGLATGEAIPSAYTAAGVSAGVSGAPSSEGFSFSHPAAPGEGAQGGAASSDDRAPVINQPPRGSVLGGAGLDVDF